MKYRKIFTFILLLCTIFSTLLFITPKVKAQEITDLTGTTWEFNDILNFEDILFQNEQLGLYFVDSIGDTYTAIGFSDFPFPVNGMYYVNGIDNIIAYNSELNSWVSNSLKTITFIEGEGLDYTNTYLISWLYDNATLIIEEDTKYTISGQYQFNEEITWLYDTSEQEGILYLPFYVYNIDNSFRVDYDYMLNQYKEDLSINYFFYANENNQGVFTGQYAGTFTTSTTIKVFGSERIVYFYTADVSEEIYNWLNESGRFINDPTLDPNNPENPNSGNNPNNPNNPDFGTDTVRQIVNQVNAFLGIQIFPGLSFRDILLICIALPLLMYILKVFLGG